MGLFWGFQSLLLLERLQGGKVNLASHQMSVLFGFNLSARTQTGSLSLPVQMSEAVTFCFYWLRGSSSAGRLRGFILNHLWLVAQMAAVWSSTKGTTGGVVFPTCSLIISAALAGCACSRSTRGPSEAQKSKCAIHADTEPSSVIPPWKLVKHGIYHVCQSCASA